MGNTENDNVNTASGEIASLSEQTEKKPEKNQNSYLKLRYYLVIENVLIALAFSLFIVF